MLKIPNQLRHFFCSALEEADMPIKTYYTLSSMLILLQIESDEIEASLFENFM